MSVWWGLVARPWLKKNWVWVLLFPVGLALLLLRLTSRSQKPVEVVTTSTMAGAAKVQEDAAEKAKVQKTAAKIVHEQRMEEIEAEYEADVEAIAKKQKKTVEEIQDDPAKVNDFLMGVGKDMRDD